MLWIQEQAEEGGLRYRKVDGTLNPADLMTKGSLTEAVIKRHVLESHCRWDHGRAESSLKLNKVQRVTPRMGRGTSLTGGCLVPPRCRSKDPHMKGGNCP